MRWRRLRRTCGVLSCPVMEKTANREGRLQSTENDGMSAGTDCIDVDCEKPSGRVRDGHWTSSHAPRDMLKCGLRKPF